MVTDVYLIYNDNECIEHIGDTLKVSPFFHFIDDRTSEGKKDSWKIKSRFGAKLTPFILCTKGEKVIKAFYSETGNDIIKELIDYLNEHNIYS